MKYELGFYIPEDDILHSHHRESFESPILPSFTKARDVDFVCIWTLALKRFHPLRREDVAS
jgi:hypothetical protein